MKKYDFDTVVDRAHDPYSYSVKWVGEGQGRLSDTIKNFIGDDAPIPEDRLVFFTADMDFKCPPELTESLIKTAEHGIFGYSSPGEEYYNAVCRWFRDRFDWEFSPKSIVPCASGTHQIIADCIEKLTEPGDGIIVLTPCYSYHGDISRSGRRFVGVPLINTDEYYTVDYDALEKACAEKNNTMIVMCHPHNPTGRVFTEEEILKIGEICRRNNVLIVSDEVHIDIARKGQKVVPMMKVLGPKGVLAATAVNKTFNVAGLAMSNLIVEDPELLEKVRKSMVMATPFGISAVITAYTKCDQWVDELNEYLDSIIDYAVDRFHKDLPKAKVVRPEGTYILWVNFSGYGLTDEELQERIRSTHVMVGDGTGAVCDGPIPKQYRRICLTAPMVQIVEMCDRLAKAFADL